MEDIDVAIRAIEDAGMHLEVEDDVAGFLGVLIDRKSDGTIHMTQTGLTDRIIKALNIGDLPMKRTPAEYGCLEGKTSLEIHRKGPTVIRRLLVCSSIYRAIVDQISLWPSPSAQDTRTERSENMKWLWNELANI
jgi:hypothetical protein